MKLPSLKTAVGAMALLPALTLAAPQMAQAGAWTPSPVPTPADPLAGPYTSITTNNSIANPFSLAWSPWLGDKRVMLMAQPTGKLANDTFTWMFDPDSDMWKTTYTRTGGNATLGTSGAYAYVIEIDTAQNGANICVDHPQACKVAFAPAQFSLVTVGGASANRKMTKSIYEAVASGTTFTRGSLVETMSADDMNGNANTVATNKLARLWVEVEWNRGNVSGRGIRSMTDAYEQVPGPLPILGAGAAFGMSRRLRRRVLAARS